jgi:CelD/BcsL family acetyltransferase involved in cellulose biosynthesis
MYYKPLLEEVGARDFFLSIGWFLNLERTIVSDSESVLVYGVQSTDIEGHPHGLLPLWRRKSGKLFAPRILQSLTNYYTPFFSPILSQDTEELNEVIGALVSALWDDRNLFDALELRCMDPESVTYALLVQAFQQAGLVVQTYFHFGNWYLEVNGRSYAEYLLSLSSVLKKNIPYQTRRLERTHKVDIRLITGKVGLEQALDDYEKVYNASWRDPEGYPAFVRGLAEMAIETGSLRLVLLYVDGVPAAVQFWLVHHGIASIYKIAYDNRYAKLSLGTVLTAHMMGHMLDIEKIKAVDYLSGDDAYKKEWMSHRRERWGILAINPCSIRGIGQIIRHVGGRFAKQVFQGLQAKTPKGLFVP